MNNRKKYLRRAVGTSICAAALCLACMVPATRALFRVSVANEGSMIHVGAFSGAGEILLPADPLLQEQPTVIPSGTLCPEGTYELQLTWQGDSDGHLRVDIDYPAAEVPAPIAEEGAASDEYPAEDAAAATLQTLIFNFPAADLPGEEPFVLTLPLTLHEDAVVTVTDNWGLYVPAEDDLTPVFDPAQTLLLGEAGGISFGRPFESAVILQRTDGEEGEKLTEVVGTEPVTVAPGLYTLTVEWTDFFDAYCVLDLIPADEESSLQPLKKLIRLPAGTEPEQGAPVVIKLDVSEPALLSALTVKGTADNAQRWDREDTLAYGRRFAASATLAELPIEEGIESFPLINDEILPVGQYALLVDWTAAELGGYCIISVGDELRYLPCAVEEENRTAVLTLDLKEAAPVSVTAVMGALPEGTEAMDVKKPIVSGARFAGAAMMAPLPAEGDPVFAELSQDAYGSGTWLLSLDWSGSNVEGYALITLTLPPAEEGGEEQYIRYVLPCPVEGEPIVLDLLLEEDAAVEVEFCSGSYEGDAYPVPEDGGVSTIPPAEESSPEPESEPEPEQEPASESEEDEPEV